MIVKEIKEYVKRRYIEMDEGEGYGVERTGQMPLSNTHHVHHGNRRRRRRDHDRLQEVKRKVSENMLDIQVYFCPLTETATTTAA